MERLTENDIKEINNKITDSEQGIWREPYGINVKEKGLVIYQRHETGGVSGGSCWEDSNPQYYSSDEDRPEWQALDLTLKKLYPDISYLKYKEIEKLIIYANDTDYEYYGNRTDYDIWYLPLETLYKYLGI